MGDGLPDLSALRGRKTALVLSGGMVKAASWHVGVALALEELGFVFRHNGSPRGRPLEVSTYVGSSAGSLVGLYLAAGHGPAAVVEAARAGKRGGLRPRPVTYRDMLGFDWSWLGKSARARRSSSYDPFEGLPPILRRLLAPLGGLSGFFTTDGLRRYALETCIGENRRFGDYEADMFVVASGLDHAHKAVFCKHRYPSPGDDPSTVYRDDVDVGDAVAASMSVPPFYRPWPVRGPGGGGTEHYIDGEIRDTLSNHVAVDDGCETVISSWTHVPYRLHDEVGSLVDHGLPYICAQAFCLMVEKKIQSSRLRVREAGEAVGAVDAYMAENGFSRKQRGEVRSILEERLRFDPGVRYIDVHPDPDDYRVFFKNPFSLNRDGVGAILERGRAKTLEVFRAIGGGGSAAPP